MFLSEWREFLSAPCLAEGGKKTLGSRLDVVEIARVRDILPSLLEGKKLMFLSEWREFLSAPCLAEKKKLDDGSRLDVVEIARVPDMLPSLFPSWSS